MNENSDRWVNGEDLKYEYAYFTTEEIRGENIKTPCQADYLTNRFKESQSKLSDTWSVSRKL